MNSAEARNCGHGYCFRWSARILARNLRGIARRRSESGCEPLAARDSCESSSWQELEPEERSVYSIPDYWPKWARRHFWMPLSADGSAYEVAHGAAYACTFDDAVCLDDGRLIAVAPSGAVRGWVVDQYNGRGLSSGEVAQGKELLAAARRQDRLIVPLGIGDTTNYYHWTYQALSRVHLARRYLGAERCVFHVGPTRFPYVIGSMAALGIDERDIVSGGPVRGKVVYTHTPSMFPPSWVTRFLREVGDRVCEGVSLAPRRTYYHRGGAQRKLANDGQVSELVVRYGFGICRPDEMSFEEQVRTARASTVLLGVHGACFTNLA